MNVREIIESLSDSEKKVLKFISKKTELRELVEKTGLEEIIVKRSIQWLSNKKLISVEKKEIVVFNLGVNGKKYVKEGLPEKNFLVHLSKKSPLSMSELSKLMDSNEIKACIGILKKQNFIDIDKKDEIIYSLTDKGREKLSVGFEEEDLLKKLPSRESDMSDEDLKIVFDLLKRKNIVLKEREIYWFCSLTSLGSKVLSSDIDSSSIDKLTPGMLKDGSWKNKNFKKYDVSSDVPEISGGRRHPVSEVHNLIRDVFLSMGFKEMEGPLVESEFWCMDSMWIPQDHPARDVQDTFYTGLKAKLPSPSLIKKIKAVHEDGGDTGSTGYMKPWNVEKAKNLILRTHSTSTTFRQFGEKKLNEDCKYFYTATVYRNEATDATHLAEFVQTEGFVMGDNLGLPHLMGIIREFYAKLGITKIRFKPTYNPYTEPSMEAHYYDEKKKKWYALINSGVFRPETLLPYGIKKSVIAWGMGGTRVAALLNNITPKDMVGSNVDFDWIANHKTPEPRLD